MTLKSSNLKQILQLSVTLASLDKKHYPALKHLPESTSNTQYFIVCFLTGKNIHCFIAASEFPVYLLQTSSSAFYFKPEAFSHFTDNLSCVQYTSLQKSSSVVLG